VGAAAYRSGEKLHSIAHATYQTDGKIYAEGDKITHDFTKKGGIMYSKIMLPEHAPREYENRETLWNAVETKEKRHDARLTREIEVALQAEFVLQEQIDLLQEYIQENFVDRGMIADFSIHDKGDGNPHAHIMLTTRNISRNGFGDKNRDWDEATTLVSWRKNWAIINNRKLEEKGLSNITTTEHSKHRV